MTEVRNKFFEGYKPDFLSAYGDKRVRDWQKDMTLCEDFQRGAGWAARDLIAEQPQMSIYWLVQAAEWKAKAYEAEIKSAAEKERADGLEQTLIQTTASLVNAEAREKKLHEAMETIMNHSKHDGVSIYLDHCYIEARDVLESLYPLEKEGETK